jgi:nucleoside-triphosphatase THEP1
MVIRYVRSDIPSFEQLHLPPVLLELVMEKRGLILIAGATGSGKSTSLAAMIDHRNTQKTGHILTIEDPIEYLFKHKKSIVNQRELNVDTLTYTKALANALREAPDLIMIGEIRDRETMQHALLHTLTGHLCLATLHANNSYHALSRIINMFPHDARSVSCPTCRSASARSCRSGSCATTDGGLQPRSRSCSIRRSSPSSSRTARSSRSRKPWRSRCTRVADFEQALCRFISTRESRTRRR